MVVIHLQVFIKRLVVEVDQELLDLMELKLLLVEQVEQVEMEQM
jgi:hypothetical protein